MLGIVFLIVAQVGTQPGELLTLPDAPSACSCHYDPQPGEVVEPGQTFAATPMALAAKDPIFQAAFAVARDDRPALTQLCVRCHAPRGWLGGRGTADLQALTEADLDTGVGCDVCHRQVVESPPVVGNARITLSPSTDKRSRRGGQPFGGHGVVQTEDIGSSEACAVCHSLFNPTEDAHDPIGRNLGFPYYEQRTYEEWVASVYPARGEGCIDCHMDTVRGRATDGGPVHADLRRHDILGANDFVAKAVQILEPTAGLAGLLPNLERRTEAHLREAVELTWLEVPDGAVAGQPVEVAVRLENKTGHKLPTGYPEGRRVYLEVAVGAVGIEPAVTIGVWDPAVGDLVADPQLVKYETVHGRVEGGESEVTHHLLLMNQVRVDTRIPPEGFMPPFEDMVPAGRDFGAVAPYRHFDEPRFSVDVPDLPAGTEVQIRVRAMFQVAHGEAMTFLIRETRGRAEGEALARVWNQLDKAPPREMGRVEHTLRIRERPAATDAGVVAPDSGAGGMQPTPGPSGGGCRGTREPGPVGLLALLLLAGLRLRNVGDPSKANAGRSWRGQPAHDSPSRKRPS